MGRRTVILDFKSGNPKAFPGSAILFPGSSFEAASEAQQFERSDHPTGQGRGGLRCPAELRGKVHGNGLETVDTITEAWYFPS